MRLILAILAFLAVTVCSVAEELEAWELDNPRIHSRLVDGVLKRFSVRTVERRDGGLFLNGRRVEVKAADWPADAASCGVELTDRVIKRAVIALKTKGYNVLRPTGAPEAAIAWCEKVGLLVEDWPTADKIPAAEIVKPIPPARDWRPGSVARERVANIHLSHVHRGGGRLERPDNTLETFLWCWGNGSALECDCRKTSDGVPIMLHDDTLARVGRGISAEFAAKSVSRELTWADIADVDVGSYLSPEYASERITKMDTVMSAMAGRPKWLLFVDEKGAGPQTIAASARRFGVLDQVYYTGSSVKKAVEWTTETGGGKTLVWIGAWPWNHSSAETARTEAHFRRVRDEIAAAGWSKNVTAVSIHTYYDPDWPEPFVPSTEFIRTFVAELKAHGIHVYSIPFEGGETEEVYYRLFELGCDGFSTDYPSVMFKVIGSLKGLAR